MLSPRPRAVITVVITEVLEATTADGKREREDSDEQAKPTKQAFCGFSGFGSGSSAAVAGVKDVDRRAILQRRKRNMTFDPSLLFDGNPLEQTEGRQK